MSPNSIHGANANRVGKRGANRPRQKARCAPRQVEEREHPDPYALGDRALQRGLNAAMPTEVFSPQTNRIAKATDTKR
jgi:hypothetical protein